jgi:signal transduction histidine kinase
MKNIVANEIDKIRKIFNKKNLLQKFTMKRIVIFFALIIISISFTLFFYFQQQSENRIKNTIFEQQLKEQTDKTKAIAEIIKSTLFLIKASLQGLAYSIYLQEGDFVSNNTHNLMENRFRQINEITPIDRLILLDKNGIAKMNIVSKGQKQYIGENFSGRELVQLTKKTLSSVLSNGYVGNDGKIKIGISYPIILNNTEKKYIGLVGVIIPVSNFFKHFGNIYDINSQYLSVIDGKAVQLIHPLQSLIGLPFFGNKSQNITGHNELLNNMAKSVMSGNPSSVIYAFKNGERLNTGYPIAVDKNAISRYSLFIITPTSSIYSKINVGISMERSEMFSLIVGFTAAITILIIFLIRWNSSLDKEVKRRTSELEESNKQLSITNTKLEAANDQLKVHDTIQKEFINIAAHEFRTPLQPILGLSELVRNKINDKEEKELLDVVIKNTKRLKNLTESILDITRFESNTVHLHKEEFNLDELIQTIITEFKNSLTDSKKIKFEYKNNNIDPLIVYADKNRISQVISNLINNSIKFIKKEGTIFIDIENRKRNGNNINEIVLVKIKDTGSGIDNEILPNLFRKFTTKSFRGTGLGLYICKSIIEAHGGKIWAENNDDGIGATLSFYLYLKS